MMQITISKKPRKPAIRNEFRRQTELHTMMLPGTVMMIVFNIIPLFGPVSYTHLTLPTNSRV